MASLDQLPSAIDIYNTPVVAPPDGLTSNFERNLSSVQLATIIVFAVTFFLATASLVIRYVTTITVLKSMEPDIVLISLAWGTALGFFVSVCFEMKYGWGSDAWDISIAELSGYYNYLLPTTLTYMWSPTLTKLSILSVLFRISTNKWFRMVAYGIGTMLIVYTIVFTALLSGPCNPRTVGSGSCLNNLAIAQVILNISTDLLIITLPLPTLYKLQLPPRKKAVAGGIMTLGSAVLFASIARAPYIKIMATDINFSRRQAEAGVWSIVELNFGVLCNNLMRMKPFLRKYMPQILTMLGLSTGGSSKTPRAGVPEDPWSHRGTSRGYQLHSMEGGDSHGRFESDDGAAIVIHVQKLTQVKGKQENGSTDNILS